MEPLPEDGFFVVDGDPSYQELFEKLRVATEDFTHRAKLAIPPQEAQTIPIAQYAVQITLNAGYPVYATEQDDGSVEITVDIETWEEREGRILQRSITPEMREADALLKRSLAYAEGRRRSRRIFKAFLRNIFRRN